MKRAFHMFVKLLFSARVVSFYKRFLSRLLILLPFWFRAYRLETVYSDSIRKAELEARLQYLKVRFFFLVFQPWFSPIVSPGLTQTHTYVLDIDTTTTTSSSSPSLHTCLPQQHHLLHQQFVQPRSLIAAGILWLSAAKRQPVKWLVRALFFPPKKDYSSCLALIHECVRAATQPLPEMLIRRFKDLTCFCCWTH